MEQSKRPSDRGGSKPINPSKVGSTDRLHRRIEGLIASAIRMDCDRIEVWHVPESGARETLVSTIAIATDDDHHPTPRSLVDAIVLTLQDEASALPGGAWHAFSVRGARSQDGADVVRERVRLVGTSSAGRAELAGVDAAREGLDEDRALERASDLAMHPREVATLSGVARQQMRHNEALVASVVKGFGGMADQQSRMIEQLSQRVVTLTERLEKQADLFLDASRRSRLIEAEARAEEAKSRAVEIGGEVLKEYLPVALHRISRKYGLAGDAEIDPMLEKLVATFTEDQLPALQEVLKPAQRAIFAEMWITVQQRIEKRKAEEEKKKGGKPELPAEGDNSREPG